MKTVKPRHVPAHSLGRNSSMGESYQVKCPYCGENNLAWGGGWRDRKIERVNKCVHFDGFTKTGAFRFIKGLPITEANKDTPRWYRCVGRFPLPKTPDYRFGPHWQVTDQWEEEARHLCDGNPSVEGHVLAVKAPAAEWLAQAHVNAVARAQDALEHADWLRTELARHYPGHK